MTDNIKDEIVKLNVGGQFFQTTRSTLTWAKNTYFTALFNNNFTNLKDEKGNIFIDRNPDMFSHILNYLRTKKLCFESIKIGDNLVEEAEFFGISPMVTGLRICLNRNKKSCGSIYFSGFMVNKEKIFRASQVLACPSPEITEDKDINFKMIDSSKHSIILISAHNNYVAAATQKFVSVFSRSSTWNFIYNTEPIEAGNIEKLAINVKIVHTYTRLLAFCSQMRTLIYNISREDSCPLISQIISEHPIDFLMFTSSHLLVLSKIGKISCWHTIPSKWLFQSIEPFTCCDIIQNLLLIASENGSINCIDLEKFPVRMTDEDFLITSVYQASHEDKITAISVYTRLQYQQKSNVGYWLELAYGTSSGSIYVIGHHPETAASQLRVFYRLYVHSMPIKKIVLGEKYLISVCDCNYHVRTWALSRFRDMLNTQPGPIPISSFSIPNNRSFSDKELGVGRSRGPYISADGQGFFVENLMPEDAQIRVRSVVTGDILATLNSADDSVVTSYNINLCDILYPSHSMHSLYFFTGHKSGTIQTWNFSSIIENNELREKEEDTPKLCERDIMRQIKAYRTDSSACFSLQTPDHINY